MKERCGNIPSRLKENLKNKNPIWIHASSVGEVKLALIIEQELKKKDASLSFLLTTFTDTGYLFAAKNSPSLLPTLLPLDFSWIIIPFLQRINPRLLIIIETEIWPNLLKNTAEAHIPILLLNGRISSSSYKNYFRLKFFFRKIFGFYSELSVRTLKDYQYFFNLGVNPKKLQVNGNIKYDQVIRAAQNTDKEKLRGRLQIKDRIPIIIFASTRSGEEQLLKKVFLRLKDEKEVVRIILAPRHLERITEVKNILRQSSLSYLCWSELRGKEWRKEDILLLDGLGKLFPLFSLSYLTFVGGSLTPFGGQNLLEPAIFSQPVLFGKYVSNFKAEAELLLTKGGGIMTPDPEILYQEIKKLLLDPAQREIKGQAAYRVVIANAGALERSIQLIDQYL